MSNEPQARSPDVFASPYARPKAPWDIGRPQAPFVAAAGAILADRVPPHPDPSDRMAAWLEIKGACSKRTSAAEITRQYEAAKTFARMIAQDAAERDAIERE